MITIAPARDHFGDNFWRILQVRVNEDNRVAGGVFEAGAQGELVTEVAR